MIESGNETVGGDGKAIALALAYVNRRERTVAEVRARLERSEIPDAEVGGALEELTALGMLDDARYARLFVEDRRNLDGWGSERIARTLRNRGVERSAVAAALAATDDSTEGGSETELDRAVAQLVRRFPAPPTDARERERALGFLLRKGYASELALDALGRWRRAEGGFAT